MNKEQKTQVSLSKEASSANSDNFEESKHWERLRRVVLSKRVVTNLEIKRSIEKWKVQQRKFKEKKRKLQGLLEKAIEDARGVLEKAELRAEHADTRYKEIVSDAKRKIVISEHSKMVEKAFEETRGHLNSNTSSQTVANGHRLIRKMEAQHDRIRARKNRLRSITKERSKSEMEGLQEGAEMEDNSASSEGNGSGTVGDDNRRQKKHKRKMNKIRQELESETGVEHVGLGGVKKGLESSAKQMSVSVWENGGKEVGRKSEFASAGPFEALRKDSLHCSNEAQRRATCKSIYGEKLPRVSEIELGVGGNVQSDEDCIFEISLGYEELTQRNRGEWRGHNSRGKGEKGTRRGKKVPGRLKYDNTESDFVSNGPEVNAENDGGVKQQQQANSGTSGYEKEKDHSFDLKDLHNNFKASGKIPASPNAQGQRHLTHRDSKCESDNSGATHKLIKRLSKDKSEQVFEKSMSMSSEGSCRKESFQHLRNRYRDSLYYESTVSSLNFSLSWVSPRTDKKNVDEIQEALQELGLDAEAAEFDESLGRIAESQRNLREKLKEARRALEEEKRRLVVLEKEEMKIQKMRLCYDRFKKKEKEEREREELKRKLREEKERQIVRNKRLHRERMLLAIGNGLSRNYNFSYFTRCKLKMANK